MSATARIAALPLAAALGLLVAGCADSSSSVQPGGSESAAVPQTGGTDQATPGEPGRSSEPGEAEGDNHDQSASQSAVTVRVVDEKEFARALERHRGKVVLVDFWATWCPSCMELFPHTVELHQRLASRGLAAISLSFDDPSIPGAEPSVLRFLRSKGAAMDNLISRYGASDKSIEAFGLEDLVLPRYHLYDRSGKLRKAIRSSQETIKPETLDRAVKELLNES